MSDDIIESVLCIPNEGIDLRSLVRDIESAAIREVLSRTKGNVAGAARLLNLNRTTLVMKIKKMDLGNGYHNVL